MKSDSARSELRRAQVFGISLTEMMLILLFLMFLAAKSTLDKHKAADVPVAACHLKLAACEQQVVALKEDLRVVRRESSRLQAEVLKLKQWVATLLIALKETPLHPEDSNFIPDAEQKIAKVRGGVGRPNCLSSENSFLLSLIMEDGFITSRRLWSDTGADAGLGSRNPIVEQITGQGRVPFEAFYAEGAKLAASQKDCIFHVLVIDKTTSKDTYKPQLIRLERLFKRRIQ